MMAYTPYDKLASGLRELRKAAGLSQEDLGELGERLGVSGATISRWESGTHIPTKNHLHDLEEAFGLPFGNLVERFINTAARKRLHDRWTAYRNGEDENDGTVKYIGAHKVRLLPDGNLLVNEATIIVAPQPENGT